MVTPKREDTDTQVTTIDRAGNIGKGHCPWRVTHGWGYVCGQRWPVNKLFAEGDQYVRKDIQSERKRRKAQQHLRVALKSTQHSRVVYATITKKKNASRMKKRGRRIITR
ncbi:hypothetical protein PISMIDRAFT_437187 [Pisolithus microcarpus 441]|uniref:Uncharacterized protein n=1 Tax=Pisolithus microcarpus 441 TaxID=765257 RepID=A0A0C9YXA0_9AGAM|nr:hypothetical protein PISMIDRAFT_437187 [Pisolithus microcarpus 441]